MCCTEGAFRVALTSLRHGRFCRGNLVKTAPGWNLFLVSEALGEFNSHCTSNRGELSGTNPLTGWMVEDVSPAGTGVH